jgi:hypothetical protein
MSLSTILLNTLHYSTLRGFYRQVLHLRHYLIHREGVSRSSIAVVMRGCWLCYRMVSQDGSHSTKSCDTGADPSIKASDSSKSCSGRDFDSKFLQDCYSTMTARMNNILTKETLRCFTGSDFTGRDIITSGSRPISLYLCWPEKDLLTLGPPY